MARPDSLAFRCLDAQVVDGRADDVALRDDAGELTFAQLLHESASIAGGLLQVGVQRGDVVDLDLTGRHRVLAVLALVRLGAAHGPAVATLAGDPPALEAGPEPVPFSTLRDLGRIDPAVAPPTDDPGWARRMLEEHADVLEPLLDGRPVEL